MSTIYEELNDKLETLKLSTGELKKHLSTLIPSYRDTSNIIPNDTSNNFLLGAVERKAERKIAKFKNVSKKVLISTNLQRKIDFVNWLEKEFEELINEFELLKGAKANPEYSRLFYRISESQKNVLDYVDLMLDKHIIHTNKLKMINQKKVR